MGTGFQDHFSDASEEYARHRPTYPAELYAWLASLAPARERAWDCATGSGQAALGLAPWFEEVIATDASEAQLRSAQPAENVRYLRGRAEDSGLASASIDLVTVAQALHWFERPAFYAELARVARPKAILAAWMYNNMHIDPAFDVVLDELYREIVGPYWPGDRVLVDGNYSAITLPFRELEPPPFQMQARWTLEHVLGYVGTWSAVRRYRAAERRDPLALVSERFARAWGDPGAERLVRWPLVLRVAEIAP